MVLLYSFRLAFLSTAAARQPHQSLWSETMFMLALGGIVVVGFAISVITSMSKRPGGLLELGAVSNQWLAEHRQYQEGDRSR